MLLCKAGKREAVNNHIIQIHIYQGQMNMGGGMVVGMLLMIGLIKRKGNKIMEYNIQAIPTKYAGRQYRSQLEARWAAMFDLLGWKFEYEPFTIGEWLVDFIIYGDKEILVEVKPTIDLYEFPLAKIWRSTKEDLREILLLGCTLMESEFNDPVVGWLNDKENFENELGGNDNFYHAIFNNYDGYGFYHYYNSWRDRITGIYEGNETCLHPTKEQITRLWNEAGNKVMYRKIKIRED